MESDLLLPGIITCQPICLEEIKLDAKMMMAMFDFFAFFFECVKLGLEIYHDPWIHTA